MTQRKNILLLYFLILIELLILINSKIIIKSVINSSYMFVVKIFPSLFPTMVIGILLIKCNVMLIIPKIIKRLFNKLFNFDEHMISIFIMSMIAGTPSNAMFINEYLNNGLINKKTAENLLCCTHFINPLFIIGAVGVGIFNNIKIGIIILLMLYLSNFIKAFILRKNFISLNKYDKNNMSLCFQTSLISSIKTSIISLLNIFGIVVLFSMLISLIKNIFNLNNFVSTIINIFLEMTGGIISISNINTNNLFKILITYYALSFGGLCIHMQTISMITKQKIRYIKYLIFRII